MYFVYEAYDDNSADIFDIGNMTTTSMGERELITFGNRHEVIGLSTSGNKLHSIKSYNAIQMCSEEDANEYLRDRGIPLKNKIYASGYWWIFEPKGYKIHVDYYVLYCLGEEKHFISKLDANRTTPYIESAKTYSKNEAGKKAAMLNNRTKTGKHWFSIRVPVYR